MMTALDANGDEQAIRELVDAWQRATTAGDNEQVLGLMADDALFLVAGRNRSAKTPRESVPGA